MGATSSRARKSAEELRLAHRNEDAHAAHVAALARVLFDRTRRSLGVPAREGRLLEAACMLHDVGFALDPGRHAAAGAAIIREEGLRGFTPTERACIAAAAELHGGPWASARSTPALAALRSPRRALRLAAYLRVADGLDHSHLQDARIVSVTRTPGGHRVAVEGGGAGGNLVRAAGKTDLWRHVFGRDLHFANREPAGGPPPVIAPGSDIRKALRRLLLVQYRALADCAGLVGLDPAGEALHEFRIALRRARALLRNFRKELADTTADAVCGELTALGRRLGPLRDDDVWVQTLAEETVARALAREAGGPEFLAAQRRLLEASREAAKRHVRGDAWEALLLRFAVLARIELAGPGRRADRVEKVAARRIGRLMKRAFAQAPLAASGSAEDLHRLRIALRKLRLVAECFAPVLGGKMDRLAASLRKADRRLGRVHDLDVALARAAALPGPPPRRLAPALRRRRRACLAKFGASWSKVSGPAFRRRLRRALDRAL